MNRTLIFWSRVKLKNTENSENYQIFVWIISTSDILRIHFEASTVKKKSYWQVGTLELNKTCFSSTGHDIFSPSLSRSSLCCQQLYTVWIKSAWGQNFEKIFLNHPLLILSRLCSFQFDCWNFQNLWTHFLFFRVETLYIEYFLSLMHCNKIIMCIFSMYFFRAIQQIFEKNKL